MRPTNFLILSAFLILLAGCNGLPKFPVKEIREIDVKNGVCGIYKIEVTSNKPKYTWIKDVPLSECDGTLGFSPADYKRAENWGLNIRDDYTCKLKQ